MKLIYEITCLSLMIERLIQFGGSVPIRIVTCLLIRQELCSPPVNFVGLHGTCQSDVVMRF
jgi:hypothetical protein